MLWNPPLVYLVLDIALGRFHGWNTQQWLFYVLSLAGSMAAWIILSRMVAGMRRHRVLAMVAALTVGIIYGINLVLFYGYRMTVGVTPNYYSFEYLLDEPFNSWTLIRDSLHRTHVAAMAMAGLLFAIALYRPVWSSKSRSGRMARSRWVMGTAAALFIVTQLVLHNNIRFVDQCFVADMTTSTGVLRNISTRLRGHRVGSGGLIARMPIPLPPLVDRGPRCVDGRPLNVLIILNESLRADELGVYGYGRATSPFFDSLAASALPGHYRFDHAFTQTSKTHLSLPSLVTGVSPVSPGRVLHTQPVFWEYFKALGRQTFFITGQSHDWYNLKIFFNIPAIDHLFDKEVSGSGRGNDLGIDDRYTVDHFLTWLRERDTTRAFAGLLQFNQTHYPYLTPADMQPFGTATKQDMYDNAVRYVDAQLSRAFAGLREAGLLDRTVIVMTSDHGEAFMEHGYLGHVGSLYREVLQVPMAWIVPSCLIEAPAWRDRLTALAENAQLNVGNMDVLPTLLDFAGIWNDPAMDKVRDNFAGRSLLQPIPADRSIVSCNDTQISPGHLGISQILGRWHYILRLQGDRNAAEEIYNWDADPGEHTNVIGRAGPALRPRIYSEFRRYELCRHLFRDCGIALEEFADTVTVSVEPGDRNRGLTDSLSK